MRSINIVKTVARRSVAFILQCNECIMPSIIYLLLCDFLLQKLNNNCVTQCRWRLGFRIGVWNRRKSTASRQMTVSSGVWHPEAITTLSTRSQQAFLKTSSVGRVECQAKLGLHVWPLTINPSCCVQCRSNTLIIGLNHALTYIDKVTRKRGISCRVVRF